MSVTPSQTIHITTISTTSADDNGRRGAFDWFGGLTAGELCPGGLADCPDHIGDGGGNGDGVTPITWQHIDPLAAHQPRPPPEPFCYRK